MEMVLEGAFVTARNNVQDQLAGVTDLAAEVIERPAAQIIAESLDLVASASFENRDDVDQLIAGVKIVPHPAFELVDQFLRLDLLILLLVAVFEEENEIAQFLKRILVLYDLARKGVEFEQRNPLFDVGVVAGLLDQQRLDLAAVLLDLHLEFLAELHQERRIHVLKDQP